MKYGIKLTGDKDHHGNDLAGLWVQSFSEYTEKTGNTRPATFDTFAEAESFARDCGWKNFSIEVLDSE